ncbi:hypothetical protein [Burkholderia multivorans]|uniref:hypothetical protein n=1 Tax=Burkholderia multivorans TaxID=87883 RepID=UPI0015E4172A|nr:hypothetical protein [Burkholderia multivorans]
METPEELYEFKDKLKYLENLKKQVVSCDTDEDLEYIESEISKLEDELYGG